MARCGRVPALLRRAGHSCDECYKHGPPDGGRAILATRAINMALLPRAGILATRAINMALLTEGGTSRRRLL